MLRMQSRMKLTGLAVEGPPVQSLDPAACTAKTPSLPTRRMWNTGDAHTHGLPGATLGQMLGRGSSGLRKTHGCL